MRTAPQVVSAILELRQRHPPGNSPVLHSRHPQWSLPHRATQHDTLKRHGLVRKHPKRRKIGHPGKLLGRTLKLPFGT